MGVSLYLPKKDVNYIFESPCESIQDAEYFYILIDICCGDLNIIGGYKTRGTIENPIPKHVLFYIQNKICDTRDEAEARVLECLYLINYQFLRKSIPVVIVVNDERQFLCDSIRCMISEKKEGLLQREAFSNIIVLKNQVTSLSV